jgi:NADPH-dependent glutamate synthase beta subunit-like oxidoreductase
VREGRDVSLEGIFADGSAAVILATGAPKDRAAEIPGEDLAGVHGCLSFLAAVNRGAAPKVGARVAVVGGGNSAIDAARTAVRLGARDVTIVYRRGEAEMPALRDEVDAARDEGVAFRFLANPVAVVGAKGAATALRCVTMALGEPDASGRRRPVPVPGSEHDLPVDTVVLAIGQQGDDSLAGPARVPHAGGRIVVDPRQATGRPSVFAAGDASRGPDSVIQAMASAPRWRPTRPSAARPSSCPTGRGPTTTPRRPGGRSSPISPAPRFRTSTPRRAARASPRSRSATARRKRSRRPRAA